MYPVIRTQRPSLTRPRTHAVVCLALLGADRKSSGGASCKGRTIPPYARSYQAKVYTQEAKYVERWPSTTSAWAGWSGFDISVDRYGGVYSLLICTSSPLVFPTCHQARQQDNTY
jgi:hypothetical protein